MGHCTETGHFRATEQDRSALSPKIIIKSYDKVIHDDNCYICGSEDKLLNHRIIPKGQFAAENVVTLCAICRSKVNSLYQQFSPRLEWLGDARFVCLLLEAKQSVELERMTKYHGND